MPTPSRLISLICNATSVLSLAVVVGMLSRHYLITGRGGVPIRGEAQSAAQALTVGSRISIPDWDFGAVGTTLVMAMSTDCFLTPDAIEFYEELTRRNNSGYRVVDVFTEPVSESIDFLKATKVTVPAVRRVDLAKIHIVVTPTILLVDSVGRLQEIWPGGSQPQRVDVLRRLGLPMSPSDARAAAFMSSDEGGSVIDTGQLAKMLTTIRVPMVDVRSRPDFLRGHFKGSVSLPLDEFETRAKHELPTDATVVAICGPCPSCEGSDEQRLGSPCVTAFRAFVEMGFEDVRMLMADPLSTKHQGLRVVHGSESTGDTAPQGASGHGR